MRPVLTGLIPREVCKTPAHRTLSTGLSLVRPVHSVTPDSTSDAKGHRPVPPRKASGECFSVRKHSCDFTKFPIDAKKIYTYFSQKRRIPPRKLGRRERGTQTPLNPRNSTSFVNVLTPTSVHHQSACVIAFHKHFPKGVKLALY